jgi:hypothetical protein
MHTEIHTPPKRPGSHDAPDAKPAPGMRKSNTQDFFDAAWAGGLFRPLLIAVVAASVVVGPLSLLRLFSIRWPLGYVLPAAFVAALEGVYSTLRLGRPSWRDRRGLAFRVGEIVIVLAAFRIAVWTFGTGWPGLAEAQTWLRHPAAFFGDQFVFLGIWIFVAWLLAVGITGDFLDLALQPDEIAAHDSSLWGESRSQLRVGRGGSRSELLARFVTRWAVGGVILVFSASLARADLSVSSAGLLRLGLGSFGLPPELLVALLCYFLAGLLLISQARLAVLRGRWYNQDMDVQPMVLRRWHVNGVIAVLLVGVIAALLPMGSTSWLSGVLAAAMTLVMRLGYLMMFVLALLVAILTWPLRFLLQSGATVAPPQMTPLEFPTQADVRSMASRLPDWLGGAVLWIIVGLIVVYFGLTYLGAQGLLKGRPAEWLLRLRYWWRARWARAGGLLQAAATALSRRVQLARPRWGKAAATLQWPAVRVSALTPRERVRYFYLRMIGRAAEQGLVRPPHQTPSEFVQQLETHWPDAEVDAEALTLAFLAARYDRRPIPSTDAQGAQKIWRRVMRALRSKLPSNSR